MTTVPATVQERIALPASSRGGGAEGAGALSATDLLTMLRRRMVLIIVLFLVLSAVSLAVFLMMWRYFPKYTAEAMIECISNIPEAGLDVVPERLREDEHERFVMTQALYLKSPGVLLDALKVQVVKETHWYSWVQGRRKDHLLELDEDLHAGPVRGSNVLRVAMSCRHMEDPHLIVNEVVRRWLDKTRKRSSDAYAPQLDNARRELGGLRTQIASKREQLQSLATRLPAGAAAGTLNLVAQQVLEYGQQVAMLELERSQLEQYRSIYNDPAGVAVTAEDRQMVEMDPMVTMLAQNVFAIEQQLAADAERYGGEHVETRQLQARLDVSQERLEALRTQKLLERRSDIREAANTAYSNTQYALFVAQDNLKRAEAELQDQDWLLFQYQTLQTDIAQDVEYSIELAKHVSELDRVVTRRSAMRVERVQDAIEPLERSSPSLFMIPLGIFIALALAIGIGLAIELLDTSVRTTQDVVRHLDVAMLGAVPDVDDEEIPIEQVETAVRDAPRSMVAEAFRQIRTNLQFSAPAARQRTVMVTSPRPEDGKTTVACNLAMVVAQGGRRVLLVDANFRRPGVDRVFGDVKGRGLSNILVGEGTLTSYATPSGVPHLDVLGSGPIPPNPAELLGSETFGTFLEDAVSRYDQIIVDTAPVLLASDALVTSTAMEGVILVVRAKANSRGVARRACSLLQDVNAHLFGAVLNAAQVTRGGYFREQLRTYYEYQAEGDTAAASQPALGKDTSSNGKPNGKPNGRPNGNGA